MDGARCILLGNAVQIREQLREVVRIVLLGKRYFPQTESYIKIDFQFETGTSTIFAYEENGKHYIEQPYQGIYKIDSQLYERLQETN